MCLPEFFENIPTVCFGFVVLRLLVTRDWLPNTFEFLTFLKPLPKFRNTILLAHASRLINTDEFVLPYDVNKPKNPDLPYTNYDHFDLDKMTDDECKTEFRF